MTFDWFELIQAELLVIDSVTYIYVEHFNTLQTVIFLLKPTAKPGPQHRPPKGFMHRGKGSERGAQTNDETQGNG